MNELKLCYLLKRVIMQMPEITLRQMHFDSFDVRIEIFAIFSGEMLIKSLSLSLQTPRRPKWQPDPEGH